MSLARGKFGIEYNPRQLERDNPSGIGWLVAVVAVIAAISLTWSIVARYRSRISESEEQSAAIAADGRDEPESAKVDTSAPAEPPPSLEVGSGRRRPAVLRNLLMRLEVAEKSRNSEMAVTTIEQIRALPGAPAADIDDQLARRLGDLNLRRLLKEHCAQWVTVVRTKGGDSAKRIARERGSTFASLVLLNEGVSLNNLKAGMRLWVMDHPRFRLEVNRLALIADLYLNGKFFRRYDLVRPVGCPNGRYEISSSIRDFWKKSGLSFRRADAAELEQLLPVGTPVLVSPGQMMNEE